MYSSTAKPNRMRCAFERGQTQPNAVQIRARPNPTECNVHSSAAKPNQMRCRFEHGQTQPNACVFERAKPNRMQCAFKHGQTQPNAVQIRAQPNPTECAKPNRMRCTFERGQTQPNAVAIRARPNPTECGAHSSAAKPNRMRCTFERGQTQPNAVAIRAQPNPTECSAHSSAAKPNRMWCTFERGQTNPGHHAASASWGSHFCPLKTKVLLNGCPMHVMKAVNKGYMNHHGQHKSVQKWACKPAFIIWLVPGVLPSKWDNGTSHAIFRFRLWRMGCPISENAWDVPCQKSQFMGRPILDRPST
ncbi:hypothetical protein K438DRAFT_2109454 [Mycena galopus ATCC 62051]|nr:hypothetical protein K438DRAFT_2109454 [Mycena galopus ATCC 62051]